LSEIVIDISGNIVSEGVAQIFGNVIGVVTPGGIQSSMSRPGCPYDNSCAESFFTTLKKKRISQ